MTDILILWIVHVGTCIKVVSDHKETNWGSLVLEVLFDAINSLIPPVEVTWDHS